MKHNDTGCRERGYRHRKTEHTHMHKNNDKKRGTDREIKLYTKRLRFTERAE